MKVTKYRQLLVDAIESKPPPGAVATDSDHVLNLAGTARHLGSRGKLVSTGTRVPVYGFTRKQARKMLDKLDLETEAEW